MFSAALEVVSGMSIVLNRIVLAQAVQVVIGPPQGFLQIALGIAKVAGQHILLGPLNPPFRLLIVVDVLPSDNVASSIQHFLRLVGGDEDQRRLEGSPG